MAKNLVESMNVYRDGNLWVVVETGMPEHAVKIGLGETLLVAYEDMKHTPMQSVGRDSGLSGALTWAFNAGWIGSPDSLDEVENAFLGEDSED